MATSADELYSCNERSSNDKEDISLLSDFCVFVCESNMHLLDWKDNKIQCRTVEKANTEEYVKYVEHMKHIHKSVFGSPKKDLHPLKRDFADTIHYFQNTQPKKKLFCRNHDYYLVKKSFTEGVQYAKEGEMHIYKAIAKPLDIYILNRPLELKTLRSNYDAYTITERIPPGEMKIIDSNTYYIIIAPCHAYFKKAKVNAHGVENSAEADLLAISVENNRKRSKSSEPPNQAEAISMLYKNNMLPQLAGSKDEEYSNPSLSMELEGVNHPEKVDESSNWSFLGNKQSGSNTPLNNASTYQRETALASSSRNSPRDYTGLISNLRTNIYNQRPTVFAIRKDGNIKSYTLRSDSSFRVFLDKVTGSFAIENNDMDPYVIEYFGEGQYLREKAIFKNGSTFETKLVVQKELLDEFQDFTKKSEEVVVNYFFQFALKAIENTYKAIEATYKKFSEMRNLKMIGSCIPAIVPLNDTVFSGAISDAYDLKP